MNKILLCLTLLGTIFTHSWASESKVDGEIVKCYAFLTVNGNLGYGSDIDPVKLITLTDDVIMEGRISKDPDTSNKVYAISNVGIAGDEEKLRLKLENLKLFENPMVKRSMNRNRNKLGMKEAIEVIFSVCK
ncbi:MAG: hypothetical protein KC478_16865 [Bacteriovoracaceae bacterium]|nr:hypothetical protein [Bacteriovoracaceae bacterium]